MNDDLLSLVTLICFAWVQLKVGFFTLPIKVVTGLVSPDVVSMGLGIANAYEAHLSPFELSIIGFLLVQSQQECI